MTIMLTVTSAMACLQECEHLPLDGIVGVQLFEMRARGDDVNLQRRRALLKKASQVAELLRRRTSEEVACEEGTCEVSSGACSNCGTMPGRQTSAVCFTYGACNTRGRTIAIHRA